MSFKERPAPVAAKPIHREPKALPSAERLPLEHMPSVLDTAEYLKSKGYTEACKGVYSCDPWKFEPILYLELGQLRSSAADHATQEDAKEINRVRGLIRAGSSVSYGTPDWRKEIPEWLKEIPRHSQDLDPRIASLKHQVLDRARAAADPSDIAEVREEMDRLERLKAQFEHITQDIRNGVTGEALEPSVLAMEEVYSQLIIHAKQILDDQQLHMENVNQSTLNALKKQTEKLRHIRDLLYYRRLYPNHAKHQIQELKGAA